MKTIEINRHNYIVNDDEFTEYNIEKYCNLKLIKDLPKLELLVGLINDIGELFDNYNFIIDKFEYGGFVPINVKCKNKYCLNFTDNEKKIINDTSTDKFNFNYNENTNQSIIYTEQINNHNNYVNNHYIILSKINFNLNNYITINVNLDNEDKIFLSIPNKLVDLFNEHFKYYINNNEFVYSNLVQLIMIVKNAGDNFENVLKENMKVFDRYTILDTGSTDNTIDIIKRTLVNKKGNLYQEPFINFRESRNRSLELGGYKCKFNLILDDTYVVKNDLRKFLHVTRSDQFSDSYSLFIKSYDVVYCSNRITKSITDLRYIYKIHEVITDKNNKNVMVPYDDCYIDDVMDKYMEIRTYERKQLDIKLLNEMVEEDPENPRHFYYLANTYKLLEDYEKTEENYLKRINHKNPGFKSELIDACFELARLYNFTMNKPWDLCLKYYNMAHELDPERPDSLYFIGIHHYLGGELDIAFEYFKKAFNIGVPLDKQYSVKPTLSLIYLPFFLAQLSYKFKDYELGLKSTVLYLNNHYSSNSKETQLYYKPIVEWNTIFNKMILMPKINLRSKPMVSNNKILIFIADGGYKPWCGEDIFKEGVGGSETHVIEMSRYIKKNNPDMEVLVFCKTPTNYSEFEGVKYLPLSEVYKVITTYYIDTCIISRYSEYAAAAINSYVQNIYLFAHDLTLSCNIIPISSKIKKIFTLTEWHKKYYDEICPEFKQFTTPLGYGINHIELKKKQPFKFIFSSFANRGLLVVLMMWKDILNMYPLAELHTYCDLENEWLNANYGDVVMKIKSLLPMKNVFMHGWVSKKTLAESWSTSHIWLYPCTFMETFCLTAFEAAISKTLVIHNNLAALENTAGDRGIIIEGDPYSVEWRNKALDVLRDLPLMDTVSLINKNYDYVKDISWDKQSKVLMEIINNTNTGCKETFINTYNLLN